MKSSVTVLKVIALPVACVALSACGGSGGAQTQLPPMQGSVQPSSSNGGQQVATSSASTTPVQITIGPQTAAANTRRAMYFSPSTQSVAIVVSAPNVNPVTTTANCSPTCTATVQAPIANDTFTITLYDRSGATGNSLSTGTTTQQIVVGQPNNVGITLNGIVASASVAASTQLAVGHAGSIPLAVTARDADNNVISGTYSSPISVSVADASNSISLSATSITSSSSSLTAQYSGNASFSAAVISLSAPGVSGSNLSGTTLLPNSTPVTFTIGAVSYGPAHSTS